jgi:GTP-binding protein LepA
MPPRGGLPDFQEIKPMVFAGLYIEINQRRAPRRQAAIERSSFYERNVDGAGAGFRCGFLGLLHMEIIRAAGARVPAFLITTALAYVTEPKDGSMIEIDNLTKFRTSVHSGNRRTDHHRHDHDNG